MEAVADGAFKPALMIVAGRFQEREGNVALWDDRDPARAGKGGIVIGYIFRKVRPCNVDLGDLKVERSGDTFHLLDGDVEVCVALVNHFHERHADVYIETLQPHRGRGYATGLLGWVSDWLTENGFIHEDGCAIDNLASVGLHRKLGFVVDGHIRWAPEA